MRQSNPRDFASPPNLLTRPDASAIDYPRRPSLTGEPLERAVEGMLAGDPVARETLILGLVGIVIRVVKRARPRQPADFEDAVQEALLQLCRSLHRFGFRREPGSAPVYVLTKTWTAFHVMKVLKRERRHAQRFPTPDDVDSPCDCPMDDLFDVVAHFRQIIAALPRNLPTVLRLRYGLGGDSPLTFDEVARRMRRAPETVQRLEWEALNMVRAELTRAFPSLAEGAKGITTAGDRRAPITPAQALEIVRLRRDEGMDLPEIAERVRCEKRVVYQVLGGHTLSRVTGIERGAKWGRRPWHGRRVHEGAVAGV